MPENTEKSKSETLEQRRRAQAELIKLKKMQNGETVEAVAEEAEIPAAFGEKVKNFFFYYKWYVAAVILAAVILAVLVNQCAGRAKYDTRVVIFDNVLVSDGQAALIGDYVSRYCPDFNGDGEVNVNVINCSFYAGRSTAEFQMTMMNKLQSVIATDTESMLFVTGDDTYGYINDLGENGLLSEPLIFGTDFYKMCDTEVGYPLAEGLRISVRKAEGTLMGDKKAAVENNRNASKLFENLKAAAEEEK